MDEEDKIEGEEDDNEDLRKSLRLAKRYSSIKAL
jgi:hypothetical protein